MNHFILEDKYDINLNVSCENYVKVKMKLLFQKVKDENYYYKYYYYYILLLLLL